MTKFSKTCKDCGKSFKTEHRAARYCPKHKPEPRVRKLVEETPAQGAAPTIPYQIGRREDEDVPAPHPNGMVSQTLQVLRDRRVQAQRSLAAVDAAIEALEALEEVEVKAG